MQTRTRDCKLDVEEASDKPHRGGDREREPLRELSKFPSDIMAWHGGGQSTKNECL
jgi:hypothetical protein